MVFPLSGRLWKLLRCFGSQSASQFSSELTCSGPGFCVGHVCRSSGRRTPWSPVHCEASACVAGAGLYVRSLRRGGKTGDRNMEVRGWYLPLEFKSSWDVLRWERGIPEACALPLYLSLLILTSTSFPIKLGKTFIFQTWKWTFKEEFGTLNK